MDRSFSNPCAQCVVETVAGNWLRLHARGQTRVGPRRMPERDSPPRRRKRSTLVLLITIGCQPHVERQHLRIHGASRQVVLERAGDSTWSGLSNTATPVKGLGLLRTPNCAATKEGRARRIASAAAHCTKELQKITAPLPVKISDLRNSRRTAVPRPLPQGTTARRLPSADGRRPRQRRPGPAHGVHLA